MKRWSFVTLQTIAVVIAILAGLAITKKLIATKPRIKKIKPPEIAPFVRVEKVKVAPVDVTVEGYATVKASKEIDIVPQVSGRAIFVSDRLVTGGRVKEGELLVKIDDADYIAAVKKAEAEIKSKEALIHKLKEESEEAKREWYQVNPDSKPPALLLKIPDIEAAEAALKAAQASLEKARLDLLRTEIRAPFSAVIMSEQVDKGQYLRAGMAIAHIFSDNEVDIYVNLKEDETAFIDIPGFNTLKTVGSMAVVIVSIGGKPHEWKGQVVRAGITDEKTRTVPVVVNVKDAYKTIPPLSVGTFVKVKIKGKRVPRAYLADKSAVFWEGSERAFVWLVNSEGRLKKQAVHILCTQENKYLIDRGLKDGDILVLTPPPDAVERMKVRFQSEK